MSVLTFDHHGDHCRFESIARFQKGETILDFSDGSSRCGVLLSGEAHLSGVTESGHDTILDVLSTGDSFSETYLSSRLSEACYVIADTECTVRFTNIQKLLTGCVTSCDHHTETLRNQLILASRHSKGQSIRLSILSQRSLRDKLLVYLKYQEQYQEPGESFNIPISLVGLANYLCVDRSAMMREIKHMNKDGLIQSSGRQFRLL